MRPTPAACCAPRCAPTIRCCSWSTSGSIASRTTARRIPGADYTIPFGSANVVKPGQSLTVITYGALVQKALLAATQIERRDPAVSIEILDLRTLAPYDWEAIRASVEKTSRVIVAHEDCLSWGYGAEIAARIADELFDRPGRSGAPRGRARHLGGLPSAAGSGDSAADRNAGGGDGRAFWRIDSTYNLVMPENDVPRRTFLRGVTAATALSYSRVYGANERVQLGLIGAGERGRGDMGNFVKIRDRGCYRGLRYLRRSDRRRPSRSRPKPKPSATTASCSR